MRVLVTGAGGLLGGRLAEILASRFEIVAGRHDAPCPRSLPTVPLDILSATSIEAAIGEARPQAIVHCAALGDADRCEREPDLAQRLNVDAPEALARRCHALGVRLIALSTDLVFAGDRAFVAEAHPAQPLMVYGRTKLAGEEAVLAGAPGSVVLRVALVLGLGHGARGTASEQIAWSLRAGRRLRLFGDQYRTPVDPLSIAAAVERLVTGSQSGRFHVGGPERVSRHALGLRVARVFGLPEGLITAVSQAAEPLSTPRPADVSLDSARAVRELGWRPRPLDDAIRDSRPAPDIIATA